jgi:hypothetical protein
MACVVIIDLLSVNLVNVWFLKTDGVGIVLSTSGYLKAPVSH